jgi:spermidine synthase
MNQPSMTRTVRHGFLLFATSASVLAYEILLMRLLSMSLWHHFAYMVISLALLGFGASGSVLFLVYPRMKNALDGWLVLLAGASAVFFCLAFSLSQKIGLDPLQLVWQNTEWLKMLFTYLCMAVPFLFAGGIVGIVLTGAGEEAHILYGVDLAGAACGALAVVPALYLGPPWTLLPALAALLLVGALGCAARMSKPSRGFVYLFVAGCAVALAYGLLPPHPRMHHTKALPMTLAFPDARIETEKVGPLGMVHVVGSALIRDVPGLSLTFGLDQERSLPEQKEIFLDGDSLGPMASFRGDVGELAYLDATTMALPFSIRTPKKSLVVGAGGGRDVLLALGHDTSEIVALEANKQVADLLRGPYAEFSGHLYAIPEVRVVTREARQFLHATRERFDLIQLSLLDAFGASAGGLHSATESYLYTTEAFCLYLSRLSGPGILSVTRWLKLPPRDSLRLVAVAKEALEKMSLSERPEKHMLFIRSWKTGTLLVSKSPFLPDDIQRARAFCEKYQFDLVYYADMLVETANRFDILKEPYYFRGSKALMGREAKAFLDRYVFDVSPTRDDRPYFSHFFRWDKAQALFQHLGREWLPLIELGYLFVIATLVQALLASGLLILLPLFFLRRVQRHSGKGGSEAGAIDVMGTVLYFGCIGLAFMFLEMALIPKYGLLLSHPIYSAAVVLASILVFAGLGSLCVGAFESRWRGFLWIPVGGIFLWVAFQVLAGDRMVGWALALPLWGRAALAVGMIAVLSFFMGWLFPSGLRSMARGFPGLVPWAWGVNGCASVIGAVLGKCLAVSVGFRVLMITAWVLYLVAALLFYGWLRVKEQKIRIDRTAWNSD